MPNYVKCRVGCYDMALAKRLYCTVCDDGSERFDFEKIIPMPDWVRSTSRSDNNAPLDWYEWSIMHWGVKWNSVCTKWEEDYVEFETAWSMPRNVLREMAWQLSSEVYLDFADEDIGSNCGHIIFYPNGNEDYSPMSDDESAQMWGYKDFADYMKELEGDDE